MIERFEAENFAREWIQAWNSHDLEAVLAHYSEHVVFYSPFVARLLGNETGCIRGKASLREYFVKAFAAYPDLHFELHGCFSGQGSLVLQYRSVQGREAAELLLLDADGRVREARAHYDRT